MKQFHLSDSKWLYVLLSILLATIFWLFVRDTVDPEQDQTIRNIKVELVGENILENQNLTVKDISNETVNLDVHAKLSVIQKLRSSESLKVMVDVSKLSAPGDYQLTYNITYPSNVSATDVLINERIPANITVTVDRLASSTFTIEPRFQGSIAKGYQAGTWSVSQDTVTISGATDQVSRIAKVEAVLTGENLTERLSSDVPLTLLDQDGNVLTDLDVKLSVDTVYVTLPIVVVKTIPLKVNFLSGGGVNAENEDDYSVIIFPETITISGEKDDMENLDEIFLGSVDLAKVVGTNVFTFPIDLDTRLENVSGITQATVTVTVSGLDTKTFEVDNIDLINTQGRRAEQITEVCSVVVRGHQEDLDQLDASQLRIVADLADVTTTGSSRVPVKVYLNASQDVGVIGEYSIVVNIS